MGRITIFQRGQLRSKKVLLCLVAAGSHWWALSCEYKSAGDNTGPTYEGVIGCLWVIGVMPLCLCFFLAFLAQGFWFLTQFSLLPQTLALPVCSLFFLCFSLHPGLSAFWLSSFAYLYFITSVGSGISQTYVIFLSLIVQTHRAVTVFFSPCSLETSSE